MVILFITYNQKTQDKHFSVPQKSTTPLYTYLIEEDRKCTGGAPFLLLLISSIPEESHTRHVLRGTWANESLVHGVRIMRLFLLGRSKSNKKVIQESDQFHDIIMQNFTDSYYNLTAKTLMGMEWIGRFCPDVKYVMKIDTDMFFNPWFLVEKVLQPQRPPKTNFFTGLIVHNALPHRDKGSKWYISTKVYSGKYYPPYCSGTGYIFSGDLAKKIYLAAEGLHIFPFEDVFVGMCLQKLGVKIVELTQTWFIGESLPYDGCTYTKLITVHRFTPEKLSEVWPKFTAARETC
ncbi:beta-1,3-galactosyltransferase 2-like [Dendropsophus ebraccatus]|uniref:beta-1,3-galactosyltransferase 2-like n=1 Tax=Dendropsophus ebraccatus TaxID=150705 RepID=UPI0038312092